MRSLASLLALVFTAFSALATPKPCTGSGRIETLQLTSTVFHNTRTLRIWLPPDYNSPAHKQDRYPVLYLNDGQNLFDTCTAQSGREWRADETAAQLIAQKKIRPLIIVGIDNPGLRDRPKEHLPYPDDTLSPPTPDVHGKDYPKFLLDEVIPLINRSFRTDPSPRCTVLGGASYGAGIALYTVITHPGRFGALLLESPSIYADNYHLLESIEKIREWPAKIFIGVGDTAEPADDVARLESIFRRAGFGPNRLRVLRQTHAAHNEFAWSSRFPSALQFLFP